MVGRFRRDLAILCAVALLLSSFAPAALAHGSADQQQLGAGTQFSLNSGFWVGQTFTPTQNNMVGFSLNYNHAIGSATYQIRTTSGRFVTATVLATVTQAVSDGVNHFDLPSTLSLTPGVKYAIVLASPRPNTVFDETDRFLDPIRHAGSADSPYSGGGVLFGNPTSAEEPTNRPTADLWFQVFYDPALADSTPPETSIGTTPSNPSTSASASFSFASSEAGSTFRCRLDGAEPGACTSPVEYSGLTEGSHSFEVTATDAVGNADPTPASFVWTVDATAPDTTITASPPTLSTSASASFSFTASEAGSTFECLLDGGQLAACSSPKTYSGLVDGSHTFRVQAKDGVGNVDPTPADLSWTVDQTPPDTRITDQPANPSNSRGATFRFSSEPGNSFECKLDGGQFATCTSPRSYSGLADGAHSFEVRTTDELGNADPSPATYSWSVSDDLDGDGIKNSVDPSETNPANKSFSDKPAPLNGKTSGKIVSLDSGITVTIADAVPNPAQGLRVTVAGPTGGRARLTLDGKSGTYRLRPGSYVLTDPPATITIEVSDGGRAEAEYLSGGQVVTIVIESNSTASITEPLAAGTLVTVTVEKGTVTLNGTPVKPGPSLPIYDLCELTKIAKDASRGTEPPNELLTALKDAFVNKTPFGILVHRCGTSRGGSTLVIAQVISRQVDPRAPQKVTYTVRFTVEGHSQTLTFSARR